MQQEFAEIEQETVRVLGEERANFFVSLWDDSFTIYDAMKRTYPEAQLLDSMVWARSLELWLAIIGRFPACAEHVAREKLVVEYPVTQLILGKSSCI